MKEIQLYGAEWCGDCVRAKKFLDSKSIQYEDIDIGEVQGAAEKVMEINGGKKIIPTIIIDGKPYTNPNNSVLAEALGL